MCADDLVLTLANKSIGTPQQKHNYYIKHNQTIILYKQSDSKREKTVQINFTTKYILQTQEFISSTT